MEKKGLSDSSSSDFEDERPSFGGPMYQGFETGGKKRKFEDVAFKEANFERNFEEASDEPECPTKKRRLDAPAQRIMEKMGYKEGVGLGKHGQGRLEPVEASKHKGRRGLGHYNDKLKDANLRWDPNEEVISVQEEIEWLTNSQQPVTAKELERWMEIGPSKDTIDDETNFCDPNIVMQVVSSKSVFDNLDKTEMRRARTRSNPFETIRKAFFLNRAAVKMANMDKACNFMFTQPKTLKTGELLYFADVCAGPGGFSEYVLYRKKWRSKGFGFTLRESNDFKLEDFYAGSPETFHPFYGKKGDGDVYNPENQKDFEEMIKRQTRNEGVHFMMSDGGFSVEGQESIQEILSKQLYLCQCLVALMIVRDGGNFVTKLFDIFTPFSAGLVYLMYRCFKRITIFKPNSSRPANSERYLICEGKLPNVKDVIDYLARANRAILKKDKNRDVVGLVPLETLEEDVQFFQYLKNSNENLGKKQVVGLLKIAAFCEDTALFEPRQAEMRKECLQYWGLPDITRMIPRNVKPEENMRRSIPDLRLLKLPGTALTIKNIDSTILNTPLDWFWMACGSMRCSKDENAATFYMGMGQKKTFRYVNESWVRAIDVELPPDTIIYAEMVLELRGENRYQRKTTALHILDAYKLGGEDVSQKHIQDRYELIKMFCEALWKPENSKIRVRAKELHCIPNGLEDKLQLKMVIMKNGIRAQAHLPTSSLTNYDNDGDEPYYIIPKSLLFLKGTAQNWSRHVSRSTGHRYYFNCKDRTTRYDNDRPATANAAFPESFENRVIYDMCPPDPELTLDVLHSWIQEKRQVLNQTQ